MEARDALLGGRQINSKPFIPETRVDVVYPEGAADLYMCVREADTSKWDKHPCVVIDDLVKGKPAIKYKHALDQEEIIMSGGPLRLVGVIDQWYLGREKIGVADLLERKPEFKDYIITRSINYIQLKREEYLDPDYLGSEADRESVLEGVQAFEEELQEAGIKPYDYLK